MQNSQDELVAKLKQAQNVLVTVSRDPSVDQLSAAIGLTVALNNLNKHASAVFSGQVPSTIEFLQPEETLEKNTDSLRDFIIALDKSKADKLRYKVEDSVVRIFITPYKTSISQDDLDFSQGDFNVDVVVALGVQTQQDLDDAIQAHGRILHDAVVATVTLDGQSDLGTLHVSGNGSTSLSELVANMLTQIDKKLLDSQTATALLTGIVSVTERFRNDKTTPTTMSVSSALMAAGANQQLIANELEAEPELVSEVTLPSVDQENQEIIIDETGTLAINHGEEEPEITEQPVPEPVEAQVLEPPMPEPAVPDQGNYSVEEGGLVGQENGAYPSTRGRVIQPPSRGGTLTANTQEEPLDKGTDELTLPTQQHTPMLSHDSPIGPLKQPSSDVAATMSAAQPPIVDTSVYEQPSAVDVPAPPTSIAPPVAVQPPTPVQSPAVAQEAPTATQTPLPPPAPLSFTPPPVPPVTSSPPYVPPYPPAPVSNLPTAEQILQPPPDPAATVLEQPTMPTTLPQPDSAPSASSEVPDPLVKTLADLEREIGVESAGTESAVPAMPTSSQKVQPTPQQVQESDAESARKAVEAALAGMDATNPEPIAALNAQPLGDDLHADEVPAVDPVAVDLPPETPVLVPDPSYERPESPSSFPGVMPESHQEDEGEAAPPVPPPFVPPHSVE